MDQATTARKTTNRDPTAVYVSDLSSSTNIWEQTSHSVPRRRVLPPEIVHIIMEIIGKDRETLGACALAAREFTFAALCCLGRHIAVNSVPRLRECANLVTKNSAFQHVRSLDLGITTKRVIHERDWDDYLVILESFARHRTLTRLWLSEVPFYFSKRGNEGTVADIIASLTATVNELGLYSCHFSCYAEMISLIRAFPLCTSLHVRDCVTRKTPKDDIFAKLPQHTPSISDLELTSSSGHRFLIDLSTLIKDAALDVSSLASFSCDMTTADAVHHTMVTAVAPPIERLQLVCDEAQGFHVLADPAITTWPLKSLTIGPLFQKDDWWCERALTLTPNLPHLEDITILGAYKKPIRGSLQFWKRMDQLLSRDDMFPRFKSLDIRITIGSQRLHISGLQKIVQNLPTLHRAGKVRFWGEERHFRYPVYW